jgi:hypothetical protein
MSNTRGLAPQPPPEVTAYADAYRCGHCTGRGLLRRKPDRLGIWHINVHHDPRCPVLNGAAGAASSGIAAMTRMSKQTGTRGLYVIPDMRHS